MDNMKYYSNLGAEKVKEELKYVRHWINDIHEFQIILDTLLSHNLISSSDVQQLLDDDKESDDDNNINKNNNGCYESNKSQDDGLNKPKKSRIVIKCSYSLQKHSQHNQVNNVVKRKSHIDRSIVLEDVEQKAKKRNPKGVIKKTCANSWDKNGHIPSIFELPREYVCKIEEMKGIEVKLVAQKRLTKTDVSRHQERLMLSMQRLYNNDFLRYEEKVEMDKVGGKVKIKMMEPRHVSDGTSNGVIKYSEFDLNTWVMKQSKQLVLHKPWNDVVFHNGLREGDVIQLWSFRDQNDGLYLALVIIE